jgi:hypothetical protein
LVHLIYALLAELAVSFICLFKKGKEDVKVAFYMVL